MSSKTDKTDGLLQPWIVVWHAWGAHDFSASHEGACARLPSEALDEVKGMLSEDYHVVAAYNQAQCCRMHDTLICVGRNTSGRQKAFVVFYELILESWGSRPIEDRTGEGWIVVRSLDWRDAISVAHDYLETGCIPFLSYDVDDIEEIAMALKASWP